MKKLMQHATLLVAIALLAGCAQLGMVAPETFNQKVAVAYVTITQARDTAAALVVAGKITAADAMHVQTTADVARAGVDTARGVYAKDPSAGIAKLDAIRAGLSVLMNYLASRQ